MRRRTVVGLLTVVIAVLWAVPAFGGPSLVKLSQRITTLGDREQQHYDSLDARIKATVLYVNGRALRSSVSSQPMTPDVTAGFYRGQVACPGGTSLTGGGVDWGVNALYADYRVIESAPSLSGSQWRATVNTGLSRPPVTPPAVYAVCAYIS
jgi:hypothetical protein